MKKTIFLGLLTGIMTVSAQAQSSKVPLEKATLKGDETIETSFGDIKLVDNYFDTESSNKIFSEMDYQRACQSYVWSMPMVSVVTQQNALREKYGLTTEHDIVVLKSLKEKRGIVTGNLTTPYMFGYVDLKKGPVEFHYPAGATASGLLDIWQRTVTDIGQTGPEKAQGGTFIIVGPEDDIKKYEKPNTYTLQSVSNFLVIALRILDPSPEYYNKFKKEFTMGHVGEAQKPFNYIENKDVEWSGTAPRGLEYWKSLSQILNNEPIREIDKVWPSMLMPLGIEKGKPFNPTEAQKTILLKGAAMGELMCRNLQVNPRFAEPWWKGTSWYKSFDFTVEQETDKRLEIDERTTWFYEAVYSSKGMVNPPVGAGQVYMTSKRDKNGNLLRADKTYKLHVPANVPVKQFWSVTLYSENTRRPYDNGGTDLKAATLGSRSEQLKKNKDGSVDIYVGAKAPKGFESNYMKTVGDDGWFVYFRLYGPTEPFFDKSFKLGDWEMID
ncbi:DUF1254 domain-containing protein [Flavobacterium agrisoli]|uniref:DUF1254 domain-containing protein n=1 Tax=Flavobacterium agrisoli TaxID=2793066 RepID=A0A934PQN5_9FLAO|nr:DUF1254 domain-containing protein [Flavobacterium agrisoli]MBK0370873.1 DUF1254 domain-containing protein [Flavobacterium agrisoli]